MAKLLALLSNPDNAVKLRMDKEVKEINKRISPTLSRDFECITVPAINIDEVPGCLIREKPDLLHFSGHSPESNLSFEDKGGKSKIIAPNAILAILSQTGHYITCILINACGSAKLAEKSNEFVPHTIGFPNAIEDELAEIFSKTFYETLSLGHNISSCFEMAKGTILSDLDVKDLPILYENKELANYNKTIFRRPTLDAAFDLSPGGKPVFRNSMYYFNSNVKNIPLNNSYIVYEFVDDTIDEKDRYGLVIDLSTGSEYYDCVYGNVIVRAWLWFSEKKYGIGIESTLAECIVSHYVNGLPEQCKKAFQFIKNN
jgi:hypothetical protein